MTNTAKKRKPPTPKEAQERLNRLHGTTTLKTVAKPDAFGLPEGDPAQLPAKAEPPVRSLTTPEQADLFRQYADAIAPRNIVGKLLKFTKGDFVAGESGEEVPEGTELIAVMDELWIGHIHWLDGKPVESRIGRLIDKFVPAQQRDLPDRDQSLWEVNDKGEPRDPWQPVNYLVMRDAKTDEYYTFATGSRGGITAIADLCRHYDRDVKQHPDCFPVIALKASDYPHPNRAFGRVPIPVFTVVGRAPRDGSAAKQTISDDMGGNSIPFALAAAAAIPLLALLIGSGAFVA